MPCMSPTSPSSPWPGPSSGRSAPPSIEGICEHLRLPLYRVRSTLPELAQAALVAETDGIITLTERGRSRVKEMA